METLKSTETLPDNSSIEPRRSQTLDFPIGAPDPPSIPAAESRVPAPPPILAAESVGAARKLENPARKPVFEDKTLAMADPNLGFPPVASPGKQKSGSNLAGEKGGATDGEESPFAAGDFVWGKSKGPTWWPGRAVDPLLPSELANKAPHKGHCILVAFAGGGGFQWCEPSQLKPFVKVFGPMSKQSRSKSFTGAVRETLTQIRRSLELELTCYCVPAEARSEIEMPTAENCSMVNYTFGEFFHRLLVTAQDVSAVNMLEATMLHSWVSASGKCCSSSGSLVYHPRRGIAELIDKVDLDDPMFDSLEGGGGQEECWINGSRAGKKSKISEELLFQSKKEKSMAKLIAEMDLDSVEVSDSEDEEYVVSDKPSVSRREKKVENVNGLDVENGAVKVEEEIGSGSGRRERKKSKYLSPPYTYLSAYGNLSTSPKNSELKASNKTTDSVTSVLLSGSMTILKCNSDVFQEAEDMGNLFVDIDSTSVGELFSEFLFTALNPLHLKWSGLDKTVRRFFSKYRSSVFSEALDADTYQNDVGDCGDADEKSADKDMSDGSEEGITAGARRKRKMRKERADARTSLDLCQDTTNYSEKEKVGPGRKRRKSRATEGTSSNSVQSASELRGKVGPEEKARNPLYSVEAPMDLNVLIANDPEEGNTLHEKKKRKDGAKGERGMELGQEPINCDKKRKKMIKGKAIFDEKIPVELVPMHHFDCSKEGNLGQQKKSKDGPNGEGCQTNSVDARKSQQKREKKVVTTPANPAALLLTFAPGITLPSKDDLISKFSRYGDLIRTETELFIESGCARVVFAKSSEAEKAFNSRVKSGLFSPPIPSYRLHYLPRTSVSAGPPTPIPKTPLPYIRRSLEKMISTLTGSASPDKDEGPFDELEPEARDNLVGDIRGILTKVNNMLNEPAAGISS